MTSSHVAESGFTLGTLRTTASHTIGIPHLVELLREVPSDAPADLYRQAVVEDNILGRPTLAGRQRSFRHLRWVRKPRSHGHPRYAISTGVTFTRPSEGKSRSG